jgi:alkanesulfonate monooxygenase SsuD/methylene tetrahydromethanopterin reductase-like flavin-dependent oxidoreductase (luciferase family)
VAIAPLPAQPIPVWMGGGTGEVTLRRIARLADGWMPMARASTDIAGLTARMRGYLRDAGREPSSLGIQATVGGAGPDSEWTAAARRWEQAGATHLTLGGRPDPALTAMQRLERATEVKRVLELELGY